MAKEILVMDGRTMNVKETIAFCSYCVKYWATVTSVLCVSLF